MTTHLGLFLLIVYLTSSSVHAGSVSEGVLIERGNDTYDFDEYQDEESRAVEADMASVCYEQVSSPSISVNDERLGADLGELQEIRNGHKEDAIVTRIVEARRYIKQEVLIEKRYERVRDMCVNKDSLCGTYKRILLTVDLSSRRLMLVVYLCSTQPFGLSLVSAIRIQSL